MKPIDGNMRRVREQSRSGRRMRYMNRDRGDPGYSYMVKRRFSGTSATRPCTARQCKPCYVGDDIFDSIGAAALANDMKPEKLRVRLNRGAASYRGKPIGFVDLSAEDADRYFQRKTWEWRGKIYDTQAEWSKVAAADLGITPNAVRQRWYRNGHLDLLKTYQRAIVKMAKAPRKTAKAKFKPRRRPTPKTVPCDRGFFLGTDEFPAGRQVPPQLLSIVKAGGGMWQGEKVRVPQSRSGEMLYRELLA